MEEASVETGVDRLVGFLKEHGKSSLKDASKKLNIPETTLQLWVDFLVEERIIGLEYKFTKPYLFLNETEKTKSLSGENEDLNKEISINTFKKEFYDHAKEKQLPEAKIKELWNAHLKEEIHKQKEFFLREAVNRNLKDGEELYKAYTNQLLSV